MRYWVYSVDEKKPVGPYEVSQLSSIKGFGPDMMLCPEGAMGPDAWKPAKSFPEIAILLPSPPPAAEGASTSPTDAVDVARTGIRPAQGLGQQIQKRYGDAYTVARVEIFCGSIAKLVAVLFGIVVALISIAIASQLPGGIAPLIGISGAFLGAFGGLLLYFGGILITANGQFLLVSIDGVIQKSPFLTDSERAEVMRVELEESESAF